MFISSPDTSPAALLDQNDHSVHGKECVSCGGIKLFNQFQRDSSYKEGVRDQCYDCESAPRLSTAEHVYRVREDNYAAARSQRWGKHQLDIINEEARHGRYRHSSEIIRFLRENVDNLLFIDGNFIGDVSIYKVYGRPQPQLNNKDFEYLFYMPTGMMREYSIYEFDYRDIPIREKEFPIGVPSGRGYRTVLLRFIKLGLLDEKIINDYFGEPNGEGSLYYQWQLWKWRNKVSD